MEKSYIYRDYGKIKENVRGVVACTVHVELFFILKKKKKVA